MVCKLSSVRDESDELANLAERFAGMAEELIELAARDEHVFATYRSSTAIPRSTDDEKTSRRAAIELSLVHAADVPLEMIDVGITAIDCLRQLAEVGTPHALGDVMTGGFLLQAMAFGALENVEANASLMKTAENLERYEGAARAARHDLNVNIAALHQSVRNRRN